MTRSNKIATIVALTIRALKQRFAVETANLMFSPKPPLPDFEDMARRALRAKLYPRCASKLGRRLRRKHALGRAGAF